MASTDSIIVNDIFKTKQISLTTIADSLKDYQQKNNIADKETLTFDIDDVQFLKLIPNKYFSFGEYNADIDINPASSANNSWSRWGSLVSDCNVGNVPVEDYPNMENCLLINDTSTSNICYYYKQLTTEQQNQIKLTGTGLCNFKIAILPCKVQRNNPSFGNITSVDKTFFNNKFDNQSSFISFGAYDSSRPNLQFRFNLIFKTKFNAAINDWEVYVFSSLNEPEYYASIVPGWNGQSVAEFKCEYAPILNDQILGNLYILINNEWITVRSDIYPSQDLATYKNAPEFGSYSSDRYASLAIKYYNFKAYINNEYNFMLNGKFFEKSTDFLNYCFDTYKYNITGNGNVKVDWFFNNCQNTITLNNSSTLTFNKSWFSTDNLANYKFFEKKIKSIKCIADTGSITSFINPSKKIYNINVKDLINLETLNLSDNLLSSLDLSSNSNLSRLDVSDNKLLSYLILPTTNNLSYINISNTNITKLELINIKSTQQEVEVIANDSKITSLALQGIKVTNIDNFISTNFEYIQDINISESNIISNKTNLELFLNNLPDRTGKEPGTIFLYGKKYVSGGIQGSTKNISETLEALKNKNWIFYV